MGATQTATNILSGAATGASIGSVVPGVGTAIGAGVGAAIAGAAELYDYLTSQGVSPDEAKRIAFQAHEAKLDQTNFADTIGRSQQGAFASDARATNTGAQQGQFADYLRGMLSGNGPSLARMQLDEALEQNTKGAASAIASQRGINPALAQRLVMNRQAAANQDAAFKASQLRAQEQLGAAGMLGQALGQQRGQDIAQQQANTSMFGTATQGQNAQNSNNLQNSLETQRINANIATENARIAARADEVDKQSDAQMKGGLLSGAGNALATMATGGKKPVAAAHGGVIPGRARVHGDSPENDTVPALLSPGEVVIPRSIAQADDAPERTAAFIEALKKRKGNPAAEGFGRVLARLRELERRQEELESIYGVAR